MQESSIQRSLPTRERGLKLQFVQCLFGDTWVAPYTGAWIEILYLKDAGYHPAVAPYTGAWIEI